MKCIHAIVLIFTLSFASYSYSRPVECELSVKHPQRVAYTIYGDHSGKGHFKTIQSAIDSIPLYNTKWVRISISPERYKEQVSIPKEKPYIFLEGAGSKVTTIEWNGHSETDTSATFTSYPDNILVKSITFKNNYNVPQLQKKGVITPALSARIYGDKSAFFDCSFFGVQDTLWDTLGRHYFKNCYIEGGIDFIWGSAQSLYERCKIYSNIAVYDPLRPLGTITAQGRSSSGDTGGFVFKYCEFSGVGKGKTLLGRAYGPNSRVIIYKSNITDVVTPVGWDSWDKAVENLVYVEAENQGLGADTSSRVAWEKHLSGRELNAFVDISYIDNEGWLAKLPSP